MLIDARPTPRHARGAELLRPSYRNRAPRPGQALLAPIRQLIESVYDTLKGQLDLKLHGGRSLTGVASRIAQRLLAAECAVAALSVVVLKPGREGGGSLVVAGEGLAVVSLLRVRLRRSTLPFCQGQCGRMNFCRAPSAPMTPRSDQW